MIFKNSNLIRRVLFSRLVEYMFQIFVRWALVGQKIKKSPGQKKLVKSNKSISRNFYFDQIPFLQFQKMAKNQFLNWEKV